MIVLALCGLLVWISIEDMRRFVVRNALVVLLVVCFLAECVAGNRLAALLPHAVFAAVALALCFGAFSMRWMGGGDAKLLTAALLWFGPENSALFALALLVMTAIYALGAWASLLPRRLVGGRTAIPFGPCVCLAWMVCLPLTTVDRPPFAPVAPAIFRGPSSN